MKSKQQLNFLVYQKQNMWFSTTSTYNSSYSFQNSVFKDIMQKDVHGLFNEHKANEESYQRKFKAYKEVYPEFVYEFPSITLDRKYFHRIKHGLVSSIHK
jgi:hypothetical protein